MGLNVQLTTQQINQIASSILLTDVKAYIDNHNKEYEHFLQEEQNRNTQDKNFTSDNSIWRFYTDETICKVNINKNMKGSELENEKLICKDTGKIEIRQKEIHF